jgi:hypothetical protein
MRRALLRYGEAAGGEEDGGGEGVVVVGVLLLSLLLVVVVVAIGAGRTDDDDDDGMVFSKGAGSILTKKEQHAQGKKATGRDNGFFCALCVGRVCGLYEYEV